MKKIRTTAFFGTGFLLTVLIFEFLLSNGNILNPVKKINPDKGERYYPDKTFCSIFFSEGFGLAKTNSEGWFGKQFKDNGDDNITIAVLGNSFIVGRQVFYRDNFMSLAENIINKDSSKKNTSFFNFGLEGINLKELLYLKEEIVTEKKPDFVMVLLKKGNFNAPSKNYAPSCSFENGAFKVDTSFKENSFVKNYKKFQLLAESSVFFMVYRTKNYLSQAGQIFLGKFYTEKNIKTENPDLENNLDSVTLTDRLVLEELSKDNRVIFLLDVNAKESAMLKTIIKSSPVIDLQEPLLKLRNAGINPYYWPLSKEEGHWNIPAHKIIAQEVSNKMLAILNTKTKTEIPKSKLERKVIKF